MCRSASERRSESFSSNSFSSSCSSCSRCTQAPLARLPTSFDSSKSCEESELRLHVTSERAADFSSSFEEMSCPTGHLKGS